MKIEGHYEPAFQAVCEAFAQNFDEGLDVGASFAVTQDGKSVVDLWAGTADSAGNPWREDTIVNVYSTTKTMAGMCMLILADRGDLDFDAPVAQYWPEFSENAGADHGKENVLVKHVMSHSAGLSGFDSPVSVEDCYDWDKIVTQLAAQPCWWEPGTAHAYHSLSQGYLQGEVLRRITGKTIGTFFREEIAEPLGADFHIGLDAKHDHRVAELIPPEENLTAGVPDDDSIPSRTFRSPAMTALEPQTREWRAAEIPAAGGIGNARAIARVHSALACGGTVDGITLLSAAGVERVLEPQIEGVDMALGMQAKWGMGYAISAEGMTHSPNPRAFTWGGWGGSRAIIDLDARVSIGYAMTRMESTTTGDPRTERLINAVYASLG